TAAAVLVGSGLGVVRRGVQHISSSASLRSGGGGHGPGHWSPSYPPLRIYGRHAFWGHPDDDGVDGAPRATRGSRYSASVPACLDTAGVRSDQSSRSSWW